MHFEVSAEVPTVARSETGPPVLDVRQLSAWYAHRQAINSITLQIAPIAISAPLASVRGCLFGRRRRFAWLRGR